MAVDKAHFQFSSQIVSILEESDDVEQAVWLRKFATVVGERGFDCSRGGGERYPLSLEDQMKLDQAYHRAMKRALERWNAQYTESATVKDEPGTALDSHQIAERARQREAIRLECIEFWK